MRKQDKFIMWPAYFDSTKTRKNGRRVAKNLALVSPRVTEIKDAVEKLRLSCEIVADVAYPKMPWLKTGLLLVQKKQSKDRTISEIAKLLPKIRSATAITK